MNRQAVSLFSGGGGLDLGFIRAGGQVVKAYESDTVACEAYPRVTGHSSIDELDLTQYDLSKLPDADGYIGGPPCQDFSEAGRKAGATGSRNLWPTTIEIVRIKRPVWFLFENVRGLVTNHKVYFNTIIDELKALGYQVEWRILNAADYGVPQTRMRVFIAGRRDGQAWHWPMQTHYEVGGFGIRRWVSWGEALSDWSKGDLKPSSLPAWILREYPRRGMFETLPENGLFPGENLRKTRNHIDIGRPAMTITNATHHCRRVMLNCQVYKLDAKGAAILQTLPDWLTDLKVIGNAVPPVWAEAIFKAAFDEIGDLRAA